MKSNQENRGVNRPVDSLGRITLVKEYRTFLRIEEGDEIEEAKKPLYTSKPNLERSGMGFTIMESFMDEMKIESILGLGTKVTMKKLIKKEEVSEQDIEEVLSQIGKK